MLDVDWSDFLSSFIVGSVLYLLGYRFGKKDARRGE